MLSRFTKVQITSFIRMKLATDIKWAKAGCIALYNMQTSSEKKRHLSLDYNSRGFSAPDAPLLTHIACKMNSHKSLTNYESRMLKEKIHHYGDQLIEICDEKKLYWHLEKYFGKED